MLYYMVLTSSVKIQYVKLQVEAKGHEERRRRRELLLAVITQYKELAYDV